MNTAERRSIGTAILNAILLAVGLSHLLLTRPMTAVILALLFTLIGYAVSRGLSTEHKNEKHYGFVFASIFSLCIVIGHPIYHHHDLALLWADLPTILKECCAFFGLRYAVGHLSAFLFAVIHRQTGKSTRSSSWASSGWLYPCLMLFLILCWLPGIINTWPGTLTPDAAAQYNRFINHVVMNFSPPIHTYFIGLCSIIAEPLHCGWPAVYTVLQTLFMAAALGRIPLALIREGAPKWLIILCLVFLGPDPIIAMQVSTIVKDVVFSGFLAIMATEIFSLLRHPEQYIGSLRRCIRFILLMLLTLLNRQNVILGMFLSFPFFMLYCLQGKNRLRLISLLLIPILGYYSVTKLVYPLVGIGPGYLTEGWSLPIQQTATIAQQHVDELTDYDKDQISRYLTWHNLGEKINPRFADPVKNETRYVGMQWVEDLGGFVRLWLSLGKRWPLLFVTSGLDLNIPLWYPTLESPYFGTMPVLGQLFSTEFPFWLMLFCFFSFLACRKKQLLPGVLFLLFYWFGFLFGPVSEIRYVLPLTQLAPLLLWQMIRPES